MSIELEMGTNVEKKSNDDLSLDSESDSACDAVNLSIPRIVLCGTLMGGADVVPGVSGGTVALILGIYDRLVTAISHFDRTLFAHVRQREWRSAAKHIDLLFLISLACGVAVGIGVMLVVTTLLLDNATTRPYVLAAFFGLILSSGFLVAKTIRADQGNSMQLGICAIVGFSCALSIYYITTFHAGEHSSDPAIWYLFLCGMLAICAMILPGISGAMILVLLGTYHHVAALPKNVLKGQDVSTSLMEIAVVGLGCIVGLLAFSKLLRRLLTHHRMATMAVMCGFIFGALPKLWPFDVKLGKKHYEPTWPSSASQVVGVILVTITAVAFVLIADRISKRSSAHD